MAWAKTSGGGLPAIKEDPTYTVLSETITSKQGRAIWTSEFSIPAGRDFTVIANYAGTN